MSTTAQSTARARSSSWRAATCRTCATSTPAPTAARGNAVRVGMLAARGAVRVMYDADGAIAATELPKIVGPVLAGDADLAIGSRRAHGAQVDNPPPRYRVMWSELSNLVVRWTLVPGIRDTQCGFKAFSARAAIDLFSRGRINRWSFDLEILALARMRQYAIAEVGVRWADDPRSRVSPLRDGYRAIKELIQIKRNFAADRYRLAHAVT
ncbi:MAG: glycosyltransferase [Myxococcales bacterium]|nr:glycosyltransferase [Myxococcales bacterium]